MKYILGISIIWLFINTIIYSDFKATKLVSSVSHSRSKVGFLARERRASSPFPDVKIEFLGMRERFIGSAPLKDHLERISDTSVNLIPAAARSHVLAFRLDPQTEQRFQDELPISPSSAPDASVMLTQDGKRLILARWPAEGYASADAQTGRPHAPTFAAPNGRVGHWSREPALRIGGYWSADWAYETAKAKVEADSALIKVAPLTLPYRLAKRYRYFVYNAISELRAPGEFAISPATHELLVWPREEGPGSPPVRIVRAEHLLRIVGAHNLTIQGMEFSDCLGSAVEVINSSHITFKDDLVRNAGGVGIMISGGDHNTVDRTVIADTGASGVVLSGGDRRSLTPAGHRLMNSIIIRTAERARTNHAAVQLFGVGNEVLSSLIRDTPHSAIQFAGNDHRIAFNEIANAVTETADAGAIYTGRDLSARGTVIEHNYIHDIMPRDGTPMDVRGVYLDDFTGGDVVESNVFLRVREPIYLNGGSYNTIINNIFVDTLGEVVTIRNASDQWPSLRLELFENEQEARKNPTLYEKRYVGFSTVIPEYYISPLNDNSRNIKTESPISVPPLHLDKLKFSKEAF